jgi:hypothetical protein
MVVGCPKPSSFPSPHPSPLPEGEGVANSVDRNFCNYLFLLKLDLNICKIFPLSLWERARVRGSGACCK